MYISKINFTNPNFGIKLGPKLEDEINLKRQHIQSLTNSKRHIPLAEYDNIIEQIKKLFPEKGGSPTTVEIVDRVRDDRFVDGGMYIYCGQKKVPGYKITNESGTYRYFFNRKQDGQEYFDRYKILLTTLKKLDEKEKKLKKDPLAYCYVNAGKYRNEFSLNDYRKNNDDYPDDNDDYNQYDDGDNDDDDENFNHK